MSCYLIRLEGAMYANDEMYIKAIAGGERAFTRMLSDRKVSGRKLFDQTLYPVTAAQEERCRAYEPSCQDFDAAYKSLYMLQGDTVRRVKKNRDAGYPNSVLVSIPRHYALPQYRYGRAAFIKMLDYKAHRKYKMLPKLAAIKVCGRLYVALDAVTSHAEAPIVVTIEN